MPALQLNLPMNGNLQQDDQCNLLTVINSRFGDMLITTFISNNDYKNFCDIVIMPTWYKLGTYFGLSMICKI